MTAYTDEDERNDNSGRIFDLQDHVGATAIYCPMPLNASGGGPADASETVRIEHQVWAAETCETLCTAKDEDTAREIVAAWNLRARAAIESGDEITGPIRYVAVRFGDKVVTAPMPGFRHHHILTVAHGLGFKPSSVDDQGFALADGTFIGRTDAARLALESGQVKKLIAGPDLYSEDIW